MKKKKDILREFGVPVLLDASYDSDQKKELIEIRNAIELIFRYIPEKSECLAKALTANRMLRKRRIPLNTFLGVMKNEQCQMKAHAWTCCGDLFVTGKEGHEMFTVTAVYTNQE